MVAFCRTITGDWNWSVLDLNHCIVNHDGSLMAQDDGSFFLSAGPCSSDNATKSWANYKCSTQNDDSDERHVDHGIDLSKTYTLTYYRKRLTHLRSGGR
ncbi:hypothetical protein CLIM01_14409 [Colletotrichum limetticola]|uniref:Cyanovirin-N domain-containing protein n=1 Tax=Colletotrichum limetticola TaxID=1209924 RepID=A0ABQ9P878_9PEZI|nr:hypothetical protein CLIM01_14409 [Colletotrichum limetticola]